MTTKEILIMKALGEFEGAEEMLKNASDEMYSMVGDSETLNEINRWCERMHKRSRERLTRRIKEAEEQ